MAVLALQAATELEQEGVSCEVIDLRTFNPLDADAFISSARKTGRAVVVEECWRAAGLGGDLAHRIHEACFDVLLAPVRRVAGLDVPMPYSREIEKICIPRVETIAAAVRDVMAARY
jgi:pyruvate dehydrogenase E1 component beta subunit